MISIRIFRELSIDKHNTTMIDYLYRGKGIKPKNRGRDPKPTSALIRRGNKSIMKNIKGYHCTSKNAWKQIQAKGLKGSQWDEAKFPEMNSNPFNLKKDGAVWCYPSLAIARENVDEDEVILRVEGQGIEVDHYAHGLCLVGKANLCTASLVKKNQKA